MCCRVDCIQNFFAVAAIDRVCASVLTRVEFVYHRRLPEPLATFYSAPLPAHTNHIGIFEKHTTGLQSRR